MASSFDTYQKRKLVSSYISVVLSIGLVLFLLGCLGLLVINSKKVADHFKENVTISIFLNDKAKPVEVKKLQKQLDIAEHTKKTIYVTKTEAAELMKTETGENFTDFLGFNPLKNAIDLHLKADFVTNQNIAKILTTLTAYNFVDDVSYDEDLVELMNNNVKKISFWILVVTAVFAFIAVLLINSSIRLAIYAKRFIIKTMQMVGATKRFIRRPFLLKSINLGIIGALLALAGMAVVLYYLNRSFPELLLLSNQNLIIIVFASIFILGIVISWLSTLIATQRFLNLKTDRLYY